MRLDLLSGKCRAGSRYLTHLHRPDSETSLCGQRMRVSIASGEGTECRHCRSIAGRQLGIVYVIHFDRPYAHARHYVGWAHDWWMFELRMNHHRSGSGARLMQVIGEAGIDWRVTATFYADRNEERRIKKCGSGARVCPECRAWNAVVKATDTQCAGG